MKQIAEDGIQTENDLVDIPQRKGYSEGFDLWRMRDEIEKLCRRAEAAEDEIKTLEMRLHTLETDLRVLTRMVNDDTRKRMGEYPITGDGLQAICPT
jgi:uncharacterized protein YlxW (UPF0749 family)